VHEEFGGLLRQSLAGPVHARQERDSPDGHVCSPSPAVASGDRNAAAEVDLSLLARGALQPAERQWYASPQMQDEAADAVIMARKAVVAHQVLEDALRWF
jgi:hypothetical protein